MRATRSRDMIRASWHIFRLLEHRPPRQTASTRQLLAELLRRRRHRRGMMVDNLPNVAVLDVRKAVARGPTLGFSILDIGKCVVAGVDRRSAVHADQLLSKGDLEPGKSLEGAYEVVPQCRPIGPYRRRQRSPEHSVIGIQRQYLFRVIFTERLGPSDCGFGHVLLRAGPSEGVK